MIEQTEGEIQKEIIDYLESRGYMVFRMNSGKVRHNVRMAPPGTPDLLAMNAYYYIWIEIKRPGKEPTEDQLEMIDKLESMGKDVVVLHSLEEAKAAIL